MVADEESVIKPFSDVSQYLDEEYILRLLADIRARAGEGARAGGPPRHFAGPTGMGFDTAANPMLDGFVRRADRSGRGSSGSDLDVPEPTRGAEERLGIVRNVRSLPGHGWAGRSAAPPPDGGPWSGTSLTNFSDNRYQTTRTRRQSFAVKCPL
jgi:hypothetical protein